MMDAPDQRAGDTLTQDVQPDVPGDTTPGAPNAAVSVTLQLPPRPTPDPTVTAFTRKLWDETTNLPAFREASNAAREAQKTLFPAWHDRGDKWRGKVPLEERTRKEDRLVRTPHVYLNQRHAIAQVAPEDHTATWKPRERVKPRGAKEIIADPTEEGFADTVGCATREYLDEAGLQEWFEQLVRESKTNPIGVLKITFQNDWTTDALNGTPSSGDEQETMERLRVLVEEFARGNITKTDARFLELVDIARASGAADKSELTIWRRIRLTTVPINAFRAPDGCKSVLTVYEQPWLGDDTEMTSDQVRAKYPFRQKKDDNGQLTDEWEGVHPMDLEVDATNGDARTMARGARGAQGREVSRRSTRRGSGVGRLDVKPTLMVREVWHRLDNTVYTLVENVPYPVAKRVPDRQPDQWFPYIVVCPNPLLNDLYGISDVELQADIQHRMNRKATDEEKARWLSLGRGVYDSSVTDGPTLGNTLNAAKPGRWTGMPLNGKKPDDVMHTIAWEYKRENFDRADDRDDLRVAAHLPEQANGVTGVAKFAEEVKTANEGNAVATNFDQMIYSRALKRIYHVAAQILIFELDTDEWRDVAGDDAVIPEMATEDDVKASRQQIQQEAMTVALQTTQPVVTSWGAVDAIATQRAMKQRAQAVEAELCQLRYGANQLLSREGVYRRLAVTVDVSVNGSLDRNTRMNAMMTLTTALLQAAQAAKEAGLRFNPKPFIRRWAVLSREQSHLDDMYEDDPNAIAAALVQAVASGKQLNPDAAIAVEQVAGPIAQQAMQQQAAAAAGPQGAGGPGAHGGPPKGEAPPGATPPPSSPLSPLATPGAPQPANALAHPPGMPS